MGIYDLFFGGVSFNPANDIPSLEGKVIVVTGGNSGLGKQSILQLAKHGHPKEIWLASRSAERAQEAVDEIKKEVPDAPIKTLSLDLTSFDSIRDAAKRVTQETDRLDILMLNAGIMATPAGQTKEGYEIQFGTNHVGHALFTRLLTPLLLKTAAEKPNSDVRVVVLSSFAHVGAPVMSGGIVFDTLKTAQPEQMTWTRYGQSKLANILFASQMAKRYPQITTVSLHPGSVRTNLTSAFAGNSIVHGLSTWVAMGVLGVNVEKGARNQLWAATAPKDKLVNGEYYDPVGKPGMRIPYARDEKLAEKLWDWTEKEIEGVSI